MSTQKQKDFSQSNKWLYAAALACLWASSEIVLGSFLHNLRVPMRGSLLAAIGVMIMVSAGVRWKMNGIFWRAGLITALMKSVSPSAVLLGPMVAIFMQGLIMDFSSRVGRHYKLAYLIGGGLAVSWNFIQLILGYLLYYGNDVVDLSQTLLNYAGKELGYQSANGNIVLLLLISLYFLFGFLAAFLGIRSNKKQKGVQHIKPQRDLNSVFTSNKSVDFPYSMYFIFLIPLLVVFVLFLLAKMPYQISFTLLPGIIVFLILRYRAGLRRLAKWKFWLVFLVITMLSSLLLGKTYADGLMIGLKMNFRAVFIIIALASFSIELKHPRIQTFLNRSGSIIPSVLEATFDTLPMVISHLPDAGEFLRKPLQSVSNLISNSFIWVDSLRFRAMPQSPVLIISGEKGSGKSTLLEKVLLDFQKADVSACGFMMKYRKSANVHIGYSLSLIPGSKNILLAGDDIADVLVKVGPYSFSASAIQMAEKHVNDLYDTACVIVIDEMGPWEALGGGWYQIMKKIRTEGKPGVIVVRNHMLESFLQFWNYSDPLIIDVLNSGNTNAEIANFLKLI